jgi:chemotaxis-related protein WspB
VIDLGILLDVGPCRDCLSTRIILVNDSPDDHNRWKHDRDDSVEETRDERARRRLDPSLLGLVAENVSDLIYTQPEQIVPAPIRLPHAPYLGSIVQTDHGIVQLIVIEKVRGASLQSSDLGQDAALDSKSEPSPLTV